MVVKSKITPIIVAVVIALLVGGGVAVWAVVSKNIRSSVDVTYHATDITGTARATYQYGNIISNMKTADGKDILEFNEQNASEQKVLKQTYNVELSEINNFITFKYLFENSGNSKYNAKLTYKEGKTKDKNFKIEYKINGEGDWISANDHNYNELTVDAKTNEVNGSGYMEVKITVIDFSKNANFSGTFSWSLTKVSEGE